MKIYYGWCIVAIAMLMLMLAIGATVSAFGLFVLPVAQDFGLSRASMNTGLILLNFGMAFSAPVVGRILDRHPARYVMAGSAILFAASFIALGLSHSIWLSAFVLAVPMAVAITSGGTLTSPALVARWFTVHRGRAMSITVIGFSLGSIVVVPLIGLLLDATGWRTTLIAMGCVLGLLILLLLPFVRERPGPSDRETNAPDASPVEEASSQALASAGPISTGELLRKPQFWTLAFGAGLGFGVLQTILVSLVPVAQERGLAVATAASLISLYGGMAIFGKLILAWIADRVDMTALLAVLFGLIALICLTLLLGDNYPALIASSALLGLVAGATSPAFLAIMAERFGPASFGTVNGTATFVVAILGAACIRYGGEVYDRTGKYDFMFLSFIALAIVAGLLLFATGPLSRRFALSSGS